MGYRTDYCFTSMDLFDSKYKKKLGINMKHVRAYKQDMIKELCSQIFTYFFYLVVLDIIENNVTFVIPVTSNKMGRISVKCYEGEAFQNMYRKGCFNGIDFLASNFKGYRLMFQYEAKGDIREKSIYINGALKQKFYDNINKGKVYY